MSKAEKLVRLCNILTLSNVLGVKKSSVTNRANQMQLTMKKRIRMDKEKIQLTTLLGGEQNCINHTGKVTLFL